MDSVIPSLKEVYDPAVEEHVKVSSVAKTLKRLMEYEEYRKGRSFQETTSNENVFKPRSGVWDVRPGDQQIHQNGRIVDQPFQSASFPAGPSINPDFVSFLKPERKEQPTISR